jgi:hypothetical protein
MKTAYFVLDENALCYVSPSGGMAGVLASSVIHGSSHDPANGPIALPTKNTRPATLQDFKAFRVSPKGHLV